MDDKEIEQLFSDMPPIKDHRSKEAILARLKEDARLQKSTKRKKSLNWLPAIVAVAALLTVSLLLPSMFGEHGTQLDSSREDSSKVMLAKDDAEQVENEFERFANDSSVEESISITSEDTASLSHVLLAEEVGALQTFQIGLVSNATVIPVTFLIQPEQITADFGEASPNSIQLYQQYAESIPEEMLGFDAYHPYRGELAVENGILLHKLPNEHKYDQASATINVYINSIQSTFTDYPKLQPTDERGKPIAFDQVGLMEPIELTGGGGFSPYYKYSLPSGQFFLIPQESSEEYENVREALLGMKASPNELLQSVIPEGLEYEVLVESNKATVKFEEVVDLENMGAENPLAMIEGFMLTADQYGYVVQIENVVQQEWGKYNLVAPLPKPVAVNPIEWIGN